METKRAPFISIECEARLFCSGPPLSMVPAGQADDVPATAPCPIRMKSARNITLSFSTRGNAQHIGPRRH